MSDPYGQDPPRNEPYGQPAGQPPTHQPYGQPYQQPAYGQPAYGAPAAYASWGRRVAAYLVDAIVPTLAYAVGAVVLLATSDSTTRTTVDPVTGMRLEESGEPSGTGLAIAVLCYLAAVAFVIWNQWIRQGRTGCSLGKQALGIKLVKDGTDTPPGVGLNIGRSFAHVLDALPCYLGFLWPLVDGKNRTWADMICSTTVVLRPQA